MHSLVDRQGGRYGLWEVARSNRRGLASPSHRRWEGTHVRTIGHSTWPVGEQIAALRSADVEVLADIRTVPRSRRPRSLVADVLAVRGAKVHHIVGRAAPTRECRRDPGGGLPAARVHDDRGPLPAP